MPNQENRPGEEILDEVYQKYADSDPFMPITHFIDHSTMGAEALIELGLGNKVRQWTARHRARPYQAQVRGLAMTTDWPEALGRRECHGDWIRHFESELAARPFPVVLGEWVPRFAHEVGAFLFHGLIRTAHATRALTHKDTPARRGELARGLALWAIGVRTPPPAASPGGDSPATSNEILAYARFGAVSFLSEPDVPKLHLVTGPMAYVLIAPHLTALTHGIAKASFGKTHHEAAESFAALQHRAYEQPSVALNQARLDALAAQSDAHPAKLTEAAVRAYQASQDEIFLKAADKALAIHSLRALLGIARAVLRRQVA
jgi:hypothetical protein